MANHRPYFGFLLITFGVLLIAATVWLAFFRTPTLTTPSVKQRQITAVQDSAIYVPEQWDWWLHTSDTDRARVLDDGLFHSFLPTPVLTTLRQYQPSTISFGPHLIVWQLPQNTSADTSALTSLFPDYAFLVEPVSEGQLWIWYRANAQDIVIDRLKKPIGSMGNVAKEWMLNALHWQAQRCDGLSHLLQDLPNVIGLELKRSKENGTTWHLRFPIISETQRAQLSALQAPLTESGVDDSLFQREANLSALIPTQDCEQATSKAQSFVYRQWFNNNDEQRAALFLGHELQNLNGNKPADYAYSATLPKKQGIALANTPEALQWAKEQTIHHSEGLLQEIRSVTPEYQLHSRLFFDVDLQLELSIQSTRRDP